MNYNAETASAVAVLGEIVTEGEPAKVIETSPPIGRRCRCGVAIPAGRSAFGVTAVPASLTPLFDREVFCSMVCVRAYFLEELAILEAISGPDSETQLNQLRLMFRYLVASIERLIDEWYVALKKEGAPPETDESN